MRIVAIGDLHLDATIGGKDYHDDVAERLYEVNGSIADLVVQLGDVTDPDSGAATFRALATFAEWADFDQSVYTLVGNHDRIDDARARSALDPLRFCPGIHVIDHPFCEMTPDGAQLLFLPWMSRAHGEFDHDAFLRAAVEAPARKRIVFCHLDIPGAIPGGEADMPRLGQQLLPEWAVDDERIDYVIAGHIHTPGRVGRNVEIVGSLERLGFEDREHAKGYVVIDL